MKIVLYQPEIPQNTGNIVRTCSVTNTSLTLVRPLGFSLASRHLKRAGLDYWNEVAIDTVDDIEEALTPPFFFFSSKGKRRYTEAPFTKTSTLVFGRETSGFPPEFFERWSDHIYTIPMMGGARCLNLFNAVSVVLYEALRQQDFLF